MIIGRAELIDDLLKILKQTLDRTLPLKEEERTMIGQSRTVINETLSHFQMSIAQRDSCK